MRSQATRCPKETLLNLENKPPPFGSVLPSKALLKSPLIPRKKQLEGISYRLRRVTEREENTWDTSLVTGRERVRMRFPYDTWSAWRREASLGNAKRVVKARGA